MEIKTRTENKILNRVELSFSWKHDTKSTPSRKEVIDLVQTLEPGSNRDLIVVKDCSTRFGQPSPRERLTSMVHKKPWPLNLATFTSDMRTFEVPAPVKPQQKKLLQKSLPKKKEAMNDGRRTKCEGQVVKYKVEDGKLVRAECCPECGPGVFWPFMATANHAVAVDTRS